MLPTPLSLCARIYADTNLLQHMASYRAVAAVNSRQED